ncbi:hypothetical protein FGRMN_2023 [Fusarium graminum]|nr:hypothetical protein FGRMN_2023 [Fusarium graminum]
MTEWSLSQDHDSGHEIFDFNFTNLLFHLELSANHRSMNSCTLFDKFGSFPRKVLDPIRGQVRCIIASALSDQSSQVKRSDFEIVLLQALEAIHELELTSQTKQEQETRKRWAANELDLEEFTNNPYGLDASTIQDTAYAILGKTPEELVAEIPSEWRVIHMESVLRPDLVRRFYSYQEMLRSKLEKSRSKLGNMLSPHSRLEGRVRSTISRQDIIDDMLTPRVTYHGTHLSSVASIVRHGFKMPGCIWGDYTRIGPGIALDRGIYSSQAPFYALSYSGGRRMTPLGVLVSLRLVVCATVMGRTFSDQFRRVHGPLVGGYDAHFDGKFEYIVHDERAMLPCYVIHLDLGSEAAKQALKRLQSSPENFYHMSKNKKRPEAKSTAPGDVQREKEARKAAAMKWFPYGFGPATGTRFAIEEVGETSDDEEEYGEWQADKHAYSNTHKKEAGVWDENEERFDEGDRDGFSDTYMREAGVWDGKEERFDENDDEDDDKNNDMVKKGKGLMMDQYQHFTRGG